MTFSPDAGQSFGFVRVEHGSSGSCARRRRQPAGDDRLLRIGVEGRMQELIQRRRLDPHDRRLTVDQALAHHVHGDLERRRRRPFSGPCLQHVELALLHRKLDVLHVTVVRFEPFAHAVELTEDLGHHFLHRRQVRAVGLLAFDGQMLWGANAGDDVLALRVHQVLAVESVVARRRVARERDAGRAIRRPCCRRPSPARSRRCPNPRGCRADGGR